MQIQWANLHRREDRVRAQGIEYVKGNPQHNPVDDECCPDFSCCSPEIFEQDQVVRLHIVNTTNMSIGIEPISLETVNDLKHEPT